MGKQGTNHLVLFHKDCCDVSMIKSENKKKKKKAHSCCYQVKPFKRGGKKQLRQ